MHRGGALLRRCAGTGQPGEAFEQALGGVHTFGRLAASFHELAVYCSSLRREKQKPDVLNWWLRHQFGMEVGFLASKTENEALIAGVAVYGLYGSS